MGIEAPPRVIVCMRDAEPSRELLDAIRGGGVLGLLWFREAFAAGAREATVAGAAARVARLRGEWPAGSSPVFAVDEEGGLIQQLSGLIDEGGRKWVRLPSARALGRAGDRSAAFAHGRETGRRLRRVGCDLALAPVVDLDPGIESPVLGTRCFGSDPELVSALGLAWLEGLASAGVRGCLKHFPGHGATAVDSHVSLPHVPAGVDLFRHAVPYASIASSWKSALGPAPAVLTAHIVCGAGGLPATLDEGILARVPKGLGPILTDSLDMGALGACGDLAARATTSLRAGADLLLVGVDLRGGLALARSIEPVRSERLRAWAPLDPLPPIPEPWQEEEIAKLAAAGLRLTSGGILPEGEWDWILPARFGPYGEIASPPPSETTAARRVAHLLRYDADAPESLLTALRAASARPALVGVLHRGPIAGGLLGLLRERRWRRERPDRGGLAALAHLLDEGPEGGVEGLWTIETCGFGEMEMAALREAWERVGPAGFDD
ncbi:MAG: glycoside hydrolase family 3 protein [Candidatus Eisenbacteria bacterium]|nr:glycoside hydrolase family 3 protein [Candidatus Eisenbacteria bacterium]